VVPKGLIAGDAPREEDPKSADPLGSLDGIAREDIYDRLLEAGGDIRHE
jgi:hypothetical protein